MFDDVRFPTAIARGATGGPERRTDVVTTASGREERNSRWAQSRRRYNVGFGVKTLADIHAVVSFFEERRGRLHAFRFRDAADWTSGAPGATPAATDQLLGTSDGTTATFQLVKRYGSGMRAYARTITAPVPGSVVVAVNGVATMFFTLDAATGRISFTTGHVPAAGASVTAGFQFDVPVRFDTDQISINLSHFEAGEIPDIPLIEVLP
ncbi:MAG: DUF2460 domain-containing protein [Rhizobiales bacterium]|nr:DUF2460 domain-containing protein [Hyphomicrobiales bacterium]